MNLIIEALNHWSEPGLRFAWPMLWQSSLLIGLLFALDWALRRKARAAVRYALWLVVLLKLLLPPSLALPTGLGWWVRSPAPAPAAKARTTGVVVTYGPVIAPRLPPPSVPAFVPPPPPALSLVACALIGSSAVSLGLLAWMLVRWRQVTREVRGGTAAPDWLETLLEAARRSAGLRRPVQLRLTGRAMSPAVCGLFRPVILLPRSLVEQLAPAQLRAVLLHELIHLRRGDVWVNCLQALLQIFYWWHPLLWLANARIRRVREEAVDDAVMLALCEEAETYAPTLLEVAKLALQRPLASLGLVGILESRNALRQRIERLLDFRPPRTAGLTLVSVLSVVAFSALAVPMGEPTAATEASPSSASPGTINNSATTRQASEPASAEQRAKARNLMRDGQLLYQMGKLDEAEKKLRESLTEDPQNQAAYYYLNLIADARYKGALQEPGFGFPKPLPAPNPYVRTNLIFTNPARRAIYNKLTHIRLDTVAFDGLPLGQALANLAEQARRADPEKTGINFTLNGGQNNSNSNSDPHAEVTDISSVVINMKQALTNVRLVDALDAFVRGADKPIKYSVENNGIVVSPKVNGPEALALYTRVIKVDPNALIQSLQNVMESAPGAASSGSDGDVHAGVRSNYSATLRQFFAGMDVDLSPPKTLFFNDREGTLFVRATMQDLDLIERIVQVLNLPPPQVNIKVQFFEIPEEIAPPLLAELGPLGATDSNGTNQAILLNPEQQTRVLEKWKSQPGVELLSDASVTTLSGRQTQIQVCDSHPALKPTSSNVASQAVVQVRVLSDVAGTNVSSSLVAADAVSTTIDIVPYVSADGYSIQMTLIPSVSEFLGFEDPGKVTPQDPNNTNAVVHPMLPLPHFRVGQLTVSATVPDGQTVVLGAPVSDDAARLMGREPVQSDVPAAGRLYRRSNDGKRCLVLVLVTPTIIDPAGNRVHSGQ